MTRRLDPSDPRLAAPDFPHGEYRGYCRGCSCTGCLAGYAAYRRAAHVPRPRMIDAAQTREHVQWLLATVPAATNAQIQRAAHVGNKTLHRALTADTIARDSAARILATTADDVAAELRLHDPGKACDHVKMLLESEAGSVAAISDATGLDWTVIAGVADRTCGMLRAETVRVILATTPARVRRCAAHVPVRRATQRVRSLMANGWRITDLHPYVGYASNTSGFPFLSRPGTTITQELDRRIEAMYTEIGDRPGPSAKTARMMRAKGWYPPIHYDDDGHLIRESLRTWERNRLSRSAERTAGKHRLWLRAVALAATGQTNATTARQTGTTTKRVERCRAMPPEGVGLRSADSTGTRLAAGQDDLLELIGAATAGIELYERTDVLDTPGIDYEAVWTRLVADAAGLVDATQADEAA